MRPSSPWKVMLKPLLALPALLILDSYLAPHWLSRRLEDFGTRDLTVAQGREELILEGLSIPEGSRGLFYQTEGKADLQAQLEGARLVTDSAETFKLVLERDPPAGFQKTLYHSLPSSLHGAAPCPTIFSLATDDPSGGARLDLRLSQPEKPRTDRFRKVRLRLAGKPVKASFGAAVGPGSTAPGLSCERRLSLGDADWDFYPPLGHEMELTSGSAIDLQLERLPNATWNPVDGLWPALFDEVMVQAVKIVGRQETLVKSPGGTPSILVESVQLGADRLQIRIGGKGVMTGVQAPSLLEGFKRRSAFSGTVMILLLVFNGGGLLLLGMSLRSMWGIESSSTVLIFVSYSSEDTACMQEILKFLRGLELDVDGVKLWVDEKIPFGTKWENEISEQLGLADIALILVSQNYLNSPYCAKESQALRNKARLVVPIILSACDLKPHQWIVDLQLPHDREKTLDKDYQDTSRRNELFTKVRVALREKAQELREEKESKWPLLHRILKRLRRQKR